jgi:hypothetical protein
MPASPSVADLRFGDCCLYNRQSSFVDGVIRLKTWAPCAHVEAYIGALHSFASRNGIGVNRYPFRETDLVAVLRPRHTVDSVGTDKYQAKVRGQGYDFLGLLCFEFAKWQGSPDKQFCSELVNNWYRAGGFEAFHESWSSDRVSPGMFLQSGRFEHVWLADSVKAFLNR